MINVYELYDLYWIFVLVRATPEYILNKEIIAKVIGVLEKKHGNTLEFNEINNQIRQALRSIPDLDKEKFKFAFVDNLYVHYPPPSPFLKDEYVYEVLIESCKSLLEAIEENVDKTRDLADCLHNLPTDIVKNEHIIPKTFWKGEVKYYRNKWDKNFLEGREKHKYKRKALQ
jgi:hypothetical protein